MEAEPREEADAAAWLRGRLGTREAGSRAAEHNRRADRQRRGGEGRDALILTLTLTQS